MRLPLLTSLLSLLPLTLASLQIVPGGSWTALNTGEHIQAHGAGVTKVGDTYYLIGENKKDGSPFQSIRCYSSRNLVEWNFVGELLTRQQSGDLGPNRVVERPKVVFNERTGKYVMWVHIDSNDYKEAKVGVAVGDSVCGQYQYRGSFRPLGFESRDMGLYKDTDGTAYLLTEDRRNGLRINRLSPDYLSVETNIYTWPEKYESPAMIKHNGVYFMFTSQLTGWDTNDNKYSTATSLSGPWSSWQNFAPGGSKTHNSQTTFVLPVGNNLIMYMGDRWVPGRLMSSTYVWLPLNISGRNAQLPWYYNWVINAAAGTWSAPPSDNSYEAESGAMQSNARRITACDDCSGSAAVGYIGGDNNGSVQINNVRSDITGRTTIRIRYLNGQSTTSRYADVVVNGRSHRMAFAPGKDGRNTAIGSLTVDLNQGSGNTILFRGIGGGQWGPDIDRVLVPVS